MTVIKSEATIDTPKVIFDLAANTLKIEGECYPENPLPFFNPILEAVSNHLGTQKPRQFEVYVRLQYINSASTQSLRSLFSLLNDAGVDGSDIRVTWAYEEDDDAIEELGMDLLEDFNYVNLQRQPFCVS